MASKSNPGKKSPPSKVSSSPGKKLNIKVQKADLFKDNFWARFWPATIIFILLGFAMYYQSTSYEHVLDDSIVITENEYVKEGVKGIWKILSTESFQGYFGEQKNLVVGARYRPLSIVTFAIEHELFGLNAYVGHLVNILLYILTVIFLMRIVAALFPSENKWYWSIPFITGLLFLVHPVHTEVVANIKGRDEIMTFLGALAALYIYLKYIKSENALWLPILGLVFFLALISKENAITFLAVIPITGYYFTNASTKAQVYASLTLLAASIVYLVIRTQVIGYFLSSGTEITSLMNNPFVEMNQAEKLATIIYTLGLYLKLLVFPHPLTHDYYPYHIPIMNWGKWQVLLSFILYVGITFVAIIGLRKKWVSAYLAIFFLATISIVSNLVFPVGTFMNERFIYISSMAFCLLVAWLLIDILPKRAHASFRGVNLVGLLIILPFIFGFTWKTIDRVPVWKNGFELNKAAVAVSKNSARANCFMGTAYFKNYQQEEDQDKKKEWLLLAKPYIDRSLEIHPIYGDGLTMKAGVTAELYKFDQNVDELLAGFYEVLKVRPLQDYGNQYLDYMIRIRIEPQKQEAFYYKLGYEWLVKEKSDYLHALHILTKGLQLLPESARLNKAAGRAYELAGKSKEAAEYYRKADAILPGFELN